uniref:Uncharacterized protein n=1 Tax=Fagus sylvatica TaxID=28930 RepID=A0A2N9HYB1_FAGSY
MPPWPRIRARARALFATTHHRRHHQQCQGSLTGARQPPWPWTKALTLSLSLGYLSLCFLTEALRHPWPEQELELPHGLILTLTEVLDLAKAPSPELDSHHGHGQELSPSHSYGSKPHGFDDGPVMARGRRRRQKSKFGGMGTGLAVGAVAGVLGGLAIAEGVDYVEDKIAGLRFAIVVVWVCVLGWWLWVCVCGWVWWFAVCSCSGLRCVGLRFGWVVMVCGYAVIMVAGRG